MKQNGLTLIEVLISIFIIGIIITSIYLFFERGIDLLNLTDESVWKNKKVYNLLNLLKNQYYYSTSNIVCDTNNLSFFSYLNNDTSLVFIKYSFISDTLFIYNSKYNDTAVINDFKKVSFSLNKPDTNCFDTSIFVSVLYNNKNYTGKFFSIND